MKLNPQSEFDVGLVDGLDFGDCVDANKLKNETR